METRWTNVCGLIWLRNADLSPVKPSQPRPRASQSTSGPPIPANLDPVNLIQPWPRQTQLLTPAPCNPANLGPTRPSRSRPLQTQLSTSAPPSTACLDAVEPSGQRVPCSLDVRLNDALDLGLCQGPGGGVLEGASLWSGFCRGGSRGQVWCVQASCHKLGLPSQHASHRTAVHITSRASAPTCHLGTSHSFGA